MCTVGDASRVSTVLPGGRLSLSLITRNARDRVKVASLPHLCRLTEQTLDSCQLKRTRGAIVSVDLRWLCNHLSKWGLLGREFSLQDIALIAVFAKQRSSDPEAFALHPQPLEYDYNEFEKLLLGIAWHIYLARGKKAVGPGGQVRPGLTTCMHVCCPCIYVCPLHCIYVYTLAPMST